MNNYKIDIIDGEIPFEEKIPFNKVGDFINLEKCIEKNKFARIKIETKNEKPVVKDYFIFEIMNYNPGNNREIITLKNCYIANFKNYSYSPALTNNLKFDNCIIENISIDDSAFRGIFYSTIFLKEVKFIKTILLDCSFSSAKFFDVTNFENCEFQNKANFQFVNFFNNVSFNNCKFSDKVNFISNKFDMNANFKDCVFSKHCIFSGVQFNELVEFYLNSFNDVVDFSTSSFLKMLTINHTNFQQPAIFGNSVIHSLNLISTVFKEYALFNNCEIKNADRETFRIIKNEFLKINNKLDAAPYYAKEMEEYKLELKSNKKGNKIERFILFLNKISNDFGQKLGRGIFFTLIITLIFFVPFICCLENPYYQWGWYGFKSFFEVTNISLKYYCQFLYAGHSMDFMKDYNPSGLSMVFDIIGRLFVGYGYYQIAQSFKKFKTW